MNFKSHQGHNLVGDLNLVDPDAVVIILHGLNCDRTSFVVAELAKTLATKCNVSTFRFDFSGSGESSGPWSYSAYDRDAREIEDAVNFLEIEKKLKVVGIVGHSKAATEVLLWADMFGHTHPHPLPKLFCLSGRLHLQESPANRFSPEQLHELTTTGRFQWLGKEVTQAAIHERNAMDMVSIVRRLSYDGGAPIFLIHCVDDVVIPVEDSREIVSLRSDLFKLHEIPKGGHSYKNDKTMKSMINFISQNL